jgi:hypothetical protein
MIPAGTETMIAIEKLRAMITNNALIFLLVIFLTALVKAPKRFTFAYMPNSTKEKGSGKQSILTSLHSDWD